MHDALYETEATLTRDAVTDLARDIGLDMDRFAADVERDELQTRVERDLEDGRNAPASPPRRPSISTICVMTAPGISILCWKRCSARLARAWSARPKCSPTCTASAGLVLLLSAVVALVCANTSLAPLYHGIVGAEFGVVAPGASLSLTIGEWASEGLLTFFFLLVGLGIRREMTTGPLMAWRAALLPALAAFGGVLAPTAIYLALNPDPAAAVGWSVPTATDVAFTLGILALCSAHGRQPAFGFLSPRSRVIDDIISMVTLAIFYPKAFDAAWLPVAAILAVAMYGLNRWRIFRRLAVRRAGREFMAGVARRRHPRRAGRRHPRCVHSDTPAARRRAAVGAGGDRARCAGRGAAFRKGRRRHPPGVGAQLDEAQPRRRERTLAFAGRTGGAGPSRPGRRMFALPLFSLAASGVALSVDVTNEANMRILLGVVLGLLIGKPLGILAASALAVRLKIGIAPADVPRNAFVGAAVLCGVGDTVALLMADQAFPEGPFAQAAKVGVFAGSVLAGIVGALILLAPSGQRAPKLAAANPSA